MVLNLSCQFNLPIFIDRNGIKNNEILHLLRFTLQKKCGNGGCDLMKRITTKTTTYSLLSKANEIKSDSSSMPHSPLNF